MAKIGQIGGEVVAGGGHDADFARGQKAMQIFQIPFIGRECVARRTALGTHHLKESFDSGVAEINHGCCRFYCLVSVP